MATETYYGSLRNLDDAILLFEACRLGLAPRVQRRLSDQERLAIRPGSIFVWDEREAGMKRWTDGRTWSASRTSGLFLTYREVHDNGQKGGGRRPKEDGLTKQSISVTMPTGQRLHLVSYDSLAEPRGVHLYQPTTDPALSHVVPDRSFYSDLGTGKAHQEAEFAGVSTQHQSHSNYFRQYQSPYQQMVPANRD